MLRRLILLVAILAIPFMASAGDSDKHWRAEYEGNPSAADALADFDTVIGNVKVKLKELHADDAITEEAAKDVIKLLTKMERKYMAEWFDPEGRYNFSSSSNVSLSTGTHHYDQNYSQPATRVAVASTTAPAQYVVSADSIAMSIPPPGQPAARLKAIASTISLSEVSEGEALVYTIEIDGDGLVDLRGEELEKLGFSEGVFSTAEVNGGEIKLSIVVESAEDVEKIIMLTEVHEGNFAVEEIGDGQILIMKSLGEASELLDITADSMVIELSELSELTQVYDTEMLLELSELADGAGLATLTEGLAGVFEIDSGAGEYEVVIVSEDGASDTGEYTVKIVTEDGKGEYEVVIVTEGTEIDAGEYVIKMMSEAGEGEHAKLKEIYMTPGEHGAYGVMKLDGDWHDAAPGKEASVKLEALIDELLEAGELTKEGAKRLLKFMEAAHATPPMANWHGVDGDFPPHQFGWAGACEDAEGEDCHRKYWFDGEHGSAMGWMEHEGEGMNFFSIPNLENRELRIEMDDDGNITIDSEGFNAEELEKIHNHLKQQQISGLGMQFFGDEDGADHYRKAYGMYFDHPDMPDGESLERLHKLYKEGMIQLPEELHELMGLYFDPETGAYLEMEDLPQMDYFRMLEGHEFDEGFEAELEEVLERLEEVLEKLEQRLEEHDAKAKAHSS